MVVNPCLALYILNYWNSSTAFKISLHRRVHTGKVRTDSTTIKTKTKATTSTLRNPKQNNTWTENVKEKQPKSKRLRRRRHHHHLFPLFYAFIAIYVILMNDTFLCLAYLFFMWLSFPLPTTHLLSSLSSGWNCDSELLLSKNIHVSVCLYTSLSDTLK